MRTQHPTLARWLRRVVLVVLTVGLRLLLAATVHYVAATAKLKSVMAQLADESIPTSWAGLYEQFPDIDKQLAAQPGFSAALDMLDDVPELSESERQTLPVERSGVLPELGEDLPPEMTAALDAIRAAVREEPFWLVPSTDVWGVAIGSRSQIRQTSRLFYMSAVLHAERGEGAAALGSVVDGIRLAQVLRGGPLMVDALTRFAIEGVALGSLERVLAKTDPAPREFQRLHSLLPDRSNLRNALLGEIVWVAQLYGALASSREEMASVLEMSEPQLWPWFTACLPALPWAVQYP